MTAAVVESSCSTRSRSPVVAEWWMRSEIRAASRTTNAIRAATRRDAAPGLDDAVRFLATTRLGIVQLVVGMHESRVRAHLAPGVVCSALCSPVSPSPIQVNRTSARRSGSSFWLAREQRSTVAAGGLLRRGLDGGSGPDPRCDSAAQ